MTASLQRRQAEKGNGSSTQCIPIIIPSAGRVVGADTVRERRPLALCHWASSQRPPSFLSEPRPDAEAAPGREADTGDRTVGLRSPQAQGERPGPGL